MKLEKVYQDKSIKENEGKDSPKYFECNNSKCDNVEFSLANKEEDIVEVCVNEEEDLLKFKEKMLSELGEVSMEMEIGNYSISSKYLEKYAEEVL